MLEETKISNFEINISPTTHRYQKKMKLKKSKIIKNIGSQIIKVTSYYAKRTIFE